MTERPPVLPTEAPAAGQVPAAAAGDPLAPAVVMTDGGGMPSAGNGGVVALRWLPRVTRLTGIWGGLATFSVPIAALVTMVGALGPWAKQGTLVFFGAGGPGPVHHGFKHGSAHGWIVLGLAVAAVIALIEARRTRQWWVSPLISVIGLAIGILAIVDLATLGTRTGVSGVHAAWGIYATLLGGILLIVGGLLGTMAAREAKEDAASESGIQRQLELDSGISVEARSQWAYARRRFLRHRLAMGSLLILVTILLVGAFANRFAPYRFDTPDFVNASASPTFKGWHIFGTDLLGRDYFSRVIYGIRTSEKVAFLVAILSVGIGTTVGAIAGYYGKWVDNLLMRFTDLFLTLPGLAVLLTVSALVGSGNPFVIAFILAGLAWTLLARIVRGQFLSLREKEYVEAAKAAGAGDARIMFRHMLPNTLGPIIINGTLTVGAAILIEAALSFLGFGIQPPTAALGKLIADGQDVSSSLWWLVTFPGLTIVTIVLCVNFVGDGLRDALDPTQRKVRA